MDKSKGYTLIEVLIALSVFAILATITSTAMYNTFTTRSHINEQANQLNQLQLSLTLLERDAKQMVDRPVRGENMILVPAFIGQKDYVEFTRDGLVNPQSLEKRSTLKRVAYICKNDLLIRRTWPQLDTPDRETYQESILLEGLTQCYFSYITRSKQVLTSWQANALQQNQKLEPLPIALKVNLRFQSLGELKRNFIIPEALYGK